MPSPRRTLRQKWSEISFEKKIAMFVAPIFVVVVSTILGVVIDQRGTAEDGELEVVELAVHNAPGKVPVIDVSVRNGSETVAVLTRAEFSVRDFAGFSWCVSGIGLPPTETYELMLPGSGTRGSVANVDISQEVRPNRADRFNFEVGTTGRSGGARLYVLEVSVYHDGESVPLAGGTAIVGVPLPHLVQFDPDAGRPGCADSNIEELRRIVGQEGARPEELDFLADQVG